MRPPTQLALKLETMKQIAKTGHVLTQLQKSYGADAKLDDLAVFETTLINTKPLRKTGGIFKGARIAQSVLMEVTAAINAESIPLQIQHDTQTLPTGRLFAAAMNGLEEVRALFAVDQKVNPDIVQKIDSGTLDQVSIGMLNKQLLCSACGFDYMKPEAYEARYMLECDKEHKLGENGYHVIISGLDSLFETSLVGFGAARGARIVGPTDSIFQENQKLAASVAEHGHGPFGALYLTADTEDESTMDLTALTTQLTAETSGRAVAETKLAAAVETTTQLTAQVTTLTTERNDALTAKSTAETALTGVTAERDAAAAANTAALTALTTEATAVLTACGKSKEEIDAALKDKDCTAVLSILQENRAQFAAVIPAGGARSAAADHKPQVQARPAGSSFSTRR